LLTRNLQSLFLVLPLLLPGVAAAQATARKPAELTLAYDLLTLEAKMRRVPPASLSFLRTILEDAAAAAVAVNPNPKNSNEALAVLEAIQVALAKHNLVQPADEKDWPQTMGIALTALVLTSDSRR
jgi:hypothetical protein